MIWEEDKGDFLNAWLGRLAGSQLIEQTGGTWLAAGTETEALSVLEERTEEALD